MNLPKNKKDPKQNQKTRITAYNIEKIKQIEEKKQSYTANVKINGKEKIFIIDTGSPVTIMPMDPEKINPKEIQQIKNKYQDVNKNEVRFKGQIPVEIQHENNKQKMQVLITERNDITPLLGMDWMKKIRLTI